MKAMWTFLKSPLVRISFGLAMLTVSMLFVTDFLGLVPDTKSSEMQSRRIVAESLAVQLSNEITEKRVHIVEETLRSVVDRNESVLSGAVRLENGTVLAEYGGHKQNWKLRPEDKSTLTQVQVPIFNDQGRWGSVEISYADLVDKSKWLPFKSSFLAVITFVALSGFIAYLIFLKRTMRELNPDAVIPERVRKALDTLAEGLLIIGQDGYIVFSNASFARKIGISPKEMAGKSIAGFDWQMDVEDSDHSELPWYSALEGQQPPGSVILSLKTGLIEKYKFSVNVSPITASAGKIRGVLITFDDITEIESKNDELRRTLGKLEQSKREIMRQNQELEVLATRDPLTGALNRRSLFQGFETLFMEALEEGEELSFIMVDIDHFKSVNDRFGHAVGDKVIKLLANILMEYSRPNDLVGRFGGEEFCVILPGASVDDAVEIAERMRLAVQEGHGARFTNALRITSSFGVSTITAGAKTSSQLVEQADKALYTAKESGRNRVIRWSSMIEAENPEKSAPNDSAIPSDTAAETPVELVSEAPDINQYLSEADDKANGAAKENEHVLLDISDEEAEKTNDPDDVVFSSLPKRIILNDRIEQAIKRAQRYDTSIAVLAIDVDALQRVRDTLGHAISEKISKVVVTRLKQMLRVVDTVAIADKEALSFSVSRVTEKEILVLLTDLKDADILTTILKRIFAANKEAVLIDGEEFYLSSSVGVSLYPFDGGDAETLLQKASSALRVAKESVERNNYQFYADDIDQVSKRQMRLEAELHRAKDQDELIVYYQPKVDLRSGDILGMEALIRWQHPQMGLVPPNDFIPLAEQTGLIDEISQWVLSSVCSQIRSWEAAGYGMVPVAVNLSPVEFRNRKLSNRIIELVKDAGVPPSSIEIEITETVVMQNIETAVDILQELSQAGFGISVDDFGTGYSSLNYLRRFPLSKVKIDRSFITDFTHAQNDAAIVNAIIAMSHSLGLRVVAEGVETEEQLRFLQDLQCDEIQGYLISKPMPREQATDMLAQSASIKRKITEYGIDFTGISNNSGLDVKTGIAGILNEFPDPLPGSSLPPVRSRAVNG
ncbi:MAG: EAL domain-containing protein [Gammaproteobacteria bacterium]|nr:EAL domain-containing protein [Gammaproteobacteria bacterium]